MQRVYKPIAEQAEFTRESYAAVQRAFVSDARLELVPSPSEGLPESWTPKITVTNSGGTPTRDLRYIVREIKPGGYPITDPEPWLDEWAPRSAYVARGRVTIAPRGTAEVCRASVRIRAPRQPRQNSSEQVRRRDQWSNQLLRSILSLCSTPHQVLLPHLCCLGRQNSHCSLRLLELQ